MRKLALLVFLFVACGKFQEKLQSTLSFSHHVSASATQKHDKSQVLIHHFKAKLAKKRKRKPKGTEEEAIDLHLAAQPHSIKYPAKHIGAYHSPQLTITTGAISGRAPPVLC